MIEGIEICRDGLSILCDTDTLEKFLWLSVFNVAVFDTDVLDNLIVMSFALGSKSSWSMGMPSSSASMRLCSSSSRDNL